MGPNELVLQGGAMMGFTGKSRPDRSARPSLSGRKTPELIEVAKALTSSASRVYKQM